MAASGIENELKWRLDAAGHAALERRLRSLLGPPRVLEQRNRFYDSADRRLRRSRTSLRLRLENQRLLQTCKRFVAADGDLHRHHEEERWLSSALWPACEAAATAVGHLLPLPEAVRRSLDGAELRCLGGFDNRRLAWNRSDEAIALDTTALPRRVDHELEVETPDEAASRAWWRGCLQAWDIAFEPEDRTKFQRFLELATATGV